MVAKNALKDVNIAFSMIMTMVVILNNASNVKLVN
jgi:hypothetical protein